MTTCRHKFALRNIFREPGSESHVVSTCEVTKLVYSDGGSQMKQACYVVFSNCLLLHNKHHAYTTHLLTCSARWVFVTPCIFQNVLSSSILIPPPQPSAFTHNCFTPHISCRLQTLCFPGTNFPHHVGIKLLFWKEFVPPARSVNLNLLF